MARQRGFTLFELLLVMVIIALVVSVTVANFGDRNDDAALAEEGQRLAVLVDLALERAEVAGEEWGIAFTPEGYRFLVYSAERKRWITPRDGRFRARELPAGISANWRIEGATERRVERRRRDAVEQPDVLLLSSGEATPFRWTIAGRSDGRPWEVASDGIGAPVVRPALGTGEPAHGGGAAITNSARASVGSSR